jgi:putative endonuclease
MFMKPDNYYIYILSHTNNNVLYVRVTNDIIRRIFEHKRKLIPGFTATYNVGKLVYFERFEYIDLAIKREKQVKGYSKAKKAALINKINPEWNDLYKEGKIELPGKIMRQDPSLGSE